MINVALWASGIVMLAVGLWRVRAPFARMSELDRLAENARRYDSWRGGRSNPDEGTTGADVMRQMLRRQVYMWAAVATIGIVLIVAGFVVR
jgi:hypothetical protein